MGKQPTRLGDALIQAFKEIGQFGALSRHNIIRLWPKIVGRTFARHAKAEKLSGGTLHVIVDSAVYMNEMAGLRQVILEKINQRLEPGAAPVTELRFQQRSWATDPEKVEAPPAKVPDPTDQELRRRALLLAPIRDEELRNAMSRIMEKDRILKAQRSPAANQET